MNPCTLFKELYILIGKLMEPNENFNEKHISKVVESDLLLPLT
jgi:hypothetical protein